MHVVPVLGHKCLDAISNEDVQRLKCIVTVFAHRFGLAVKFTENYDGDHAAHGIRPAGGGDRHPTREAVLSHRSAEVPLRSSRVIVERPTESRAATDGTDGPHRGSTGDQLVIEPLVVPLAMVVLEVLRLVEATRASDQRAGARGSEAQRLAASA